MAIPFVAVALGLYAFHSAWAALGLYHTGALAVMLARRDRSAFRRLVAGFRPVSAVGWTVLGLLLGPLIYFVWPRVDPAATHVSEILRSMGLSGPSWYAFMAYYGLIHPGIEEAFWRGHIAPRMSRPWMSDVAFGAYHILAITRYQPAPAAALSVAGLAIVGHAWRRLDRSSGGLAMPWLCHSAADCSFGVAVQALTRAAGGGP
jgi:membrane protease YdiL (CAAX protease family)